jgi:hypothetical protein
MMLQELEIAILPIRKPRAYWKPEGVGFFQRTFVRLVD